MLLTNTVSCGLMMAIADVIHQQSEKLRQNHSMKFKTIMNETNKIDIKMENENQNILIIDYIDENNKNEMNHKDNQQKENIILPCKTDHDFNRTKNMLTVGLLQGPFHHYFYRFLDKTFPGKNSFSIFKKTILDQMISSPSCLAIFFFGHGFLERKNLTEIHMEMNEKFFHTWKVCLETKINYISIEKNSLRVCLFK